MKMFRKITLFLAIAGLLCTFGQAPFGPNAADAAKTIDQAEGNEDNSDYQQTPPFITAAAPPLVMLVMGRSHKLYYEAYNDASDLDGDGELDVGYKPDEIDYYGYFDNYKCYTYNSGDKRFNPTSLSVANAAATNTKACSGANEWSGDFLNYLTMSRMDAIRKVLYGGYRSTDSNSDTILQRAYVPQDAHSWGKEYKDVATDGYDITEYTPLSLPTSGRRHLFASTTLSDNGDPLLRVLTNESHRIWEWVSIERPVAGDRVEEGKTGPSVSPTDYVVRVKVCDPTEGVESNCKLYPGSNNKFGDSNDVYKPIGLLQRYGETEQMLFGLISGSYEKNTSGGVMRKTVSLISDEIDAKTGEFEYQDNSSVKGIIKTIDKLRIKNFDYSNYAYGGWPDAWVVDRPMDEGEFTDWGNPTAEMMYEGLRYFAGAGSATSAYDYSGSTDDGDLDLPKVSWDNPYSASDRWCSQPFMLVLSDIYPSYDSDQLPGSVFEDPKGNKWSEVTLGADSSNLNVEKLLDTISTTESISGDFYIGDKGGNYDSSCSPKSLSTLKDVRGLCPEEPTKQGSYYSASLAYFGRKEDISSAESDQNVLTYTVGLASPLPKIEIKLGNPTKTITLVPFAKSVGDCCGDLDVSTSQGDFQPTDVICDFYVDTLTPVSGLFRINYEDVEQAADHDQDSIVQYSYRVLKADNTPAATPEEGAKVVIRLVRESGSACVIMHQGYIISGTTADGTYLEVLNENSCSDDVDYFLDTPTSSDEAYPNNPNWDDGNDLPTDTGTSPPFGRIFTAGSTGAAELLKDPLWYAAKWGSFRDHNNNDLPDLDAEWDEDGDGNPDTYFYVQNPLFLERKLNQAFLSILERATSGTAASVLSASRSGEGAVYQSIFYPRYKNVLWTGNIHALLVDAYGALREDTNSNNALDNGTDKIIEFDAFNPGYVKKYVDTNGDGELTASEKSGQSPSDELMESIKYLWSAADWLNDLTNTQVGQNRTYSSTGKARYVFTFIDGDNDMVADSGEVITFNTNNRDTIKPYLHLFTPFTSAPAGFNENTAAENQIEFIRGIDQSGMRRRQFDSDNNNTLDKTYRLGDIISSTPTLVGTPAENYDLLYTDESYRQFWLKYRNRRKVVYAGGNDGMLHAFNAGFFYYDDQGTASTTDDRWEFHTQSNGGSETAFDLGAEIWAYVPFNLLPHLYWLTNPNYEHVVYVDQKPKIFDAKIFTSDADIGPSAKHPGGWGTIVVCGMGLGGGRIRTDKDHDGDYESGDQIMKSAYMVFDVTDPETAPELLAEISFDDLGFTTSYPGAIVVKSETSDTNPNNWYLVLGSGPNGARLKYSKKNKTLSAGDSLIGVNSGGRAEFVSINNSNKFITVKNVVGWFENGEIVYNDSDGDGKYKSSKDAGITVDLVNGSVSDLKDGLSSQKARIYVIDLKELVENGALRDPSGSSLTGGSPAGPFVAASGFDDNSQIGDFITVDLDLDYATDAMYFGTVAHTDTGLSGKLRRFVLSDPENSIVPTSPSSWDTDSVLINVGQPISTAPTIAMDWKKRTWVFFGTGRFANQDDIADASQQSFYGIKEPWQDTTGYENNRVDINEDVDGDGVDDLENEMTWEEVSAAYLMDVSDVMVFENGTIKNYNSVTDTFSAVTDLENNTLGSFFSLEQEMEEDPHPADNDPAPSTDIFPNGWKLHFSETRERNLGQAALLGDVLTFTTYAPDPNACQNEGDSYLYATFYKTGTAFSSSVIGYGTEVDPGDSTKKEVLRKQSLGKGLAVSPAMHTGREKGSKAFVQTSTGAILVIEQQNPGAVKSGRTYWMEY
jgi:type IV pilus assembly protein PilY1